MREMTWMRDDQLGKGRGKGEQDMEEIGEILNDYLLDFVYFRILRQSEGLIPVALGRKT